MATVALVLGLIATGFDVANNTAAFIKTLEAMHNHTTGVVYRAASSSANRKYKNDKCWKRCQRMAK